MGENAVTGKFNSQTAQPQSAETKTAPTEGADGKHYMTMEDFTNPNSPVWNNVDYEDAETRNGIQAQTHSEMVNSGNVVIIPDTTATKVSESYPDLRTVNKKERVQILKGLHTTLKNALRQMLHGMKAGSYEFEVSGNILEAKLYDAGVREVLYNLTQDKASMLYHSEDLFRNARYLYSTPDYDGDSNIYRWNYFYTPVQVGDNIVGVRIAIRDMVKQQESQIYNWGIKKPTQPLGGGGSGITRSSSLASSGASVNGVEAPLGGGGRGQSRESSLASSGASASATSEKAADNSATFRTPKASEPAPFINAPENLKTAVPQNGGRGNSGALSEPTIPQSAGGVNTQYAQTAASDTGDGLGAANRGFDPVSQWQLSTDRYHTINEQAAQRTLEEHGRIPTDVPMRDPKGQLVSRSVSTLVNAHMTTNEAADMLMELAESGALSHIAYTDAQAGEQAEATMQSKGWDGAYESFRNDVLAGRSSKDISMLGIALYNNAVNTGNLREAMDVAALLAKNNTNVGQALQVINMINKASPDAQFYVALKGIDNLVDSVKQRYGKRADGIKADDTLVAQYKDALEQGDQQAIDKAWKDVERNLCPPNGRGQRACRGLFAHGARGDARHRSDSVAQKAGFPAVRKCGLLFRFCLSDAGHSGGAVYAAVRHRPHRGLVRAPHGGGAHLRPHQAYRAMMTRREYTPLAERE